MAKFPDMLQLSLCTKYLSKSVISYHTNLSNIENEIELQH